MTQKLEIEIVADVVCPWCYLGWARMKEGLKLRPGVEASINWRAYQLRPELPPEGVDFKQQMIAKFGPDRLKEIQSNMREMGKDHGLEFNFDKIQLSPNTAKAHRLIRWAQKEGKLEEVAMGVMRAYFTEGKFIGDENVLADIGAAAGMDKAAILKKFADGVDKDAVAQELEKNKQEDITAVPHYIIGSRVHVDGSWPAEDMAQEFDKALEKAA